MPATSYILNVESVTVALSNTFTTMEMEHTTSLIH